MAESTRRSLPRVSFMVDATLLFCDGPFNELSLAEQGELIRSLCVSAVAGDLARLEGHSFIGRVYPGTTKRPGVPPSVRRDVLSAGACALCGSTERLTVDHIFPWSKGGTHDRANLQCLCFDCNLAKSDSVD